jgi:hypothetical protein
MSSTSPIVGVILPVIDLVLTLPTTRKDGSALTPAEIQSVTVLRDAGAGPLPLQVLAGPFNGATALFSDAAPATGNDLYSFFITDTAGTQSDTSVPVMVTVEGKRLAMPGAGTLTAVAKVDPAAKADPKAEKTLPKPAHPAPEGSAKFSAAGGFTPASKATPTEPKAETPAPDAK